MKVKLMPMLVGAFAFIVVSTPIAIKAQAFMSDQAQPAHTNHHGGWDQLNLSDQQKQQMKQIQEDTRSRIQAILTPQQQEQIKTAMQNHQAGQAHQGRESAMTALNLSDEQKAKMKEIMQAQKNRMDAILTTEQKQKLEQMRQQHQQQQNNQ